MEKMYTRKEAATLLGISITTLDQARSASSWSTVHEPEVRDGDEHRDSNRYPSDA